MLTSDNIQKLLKEKGYHLNKRIDYPNFIGIRYETKINTFDDELYVIVYSDYITSSMNMYPITTEPGLYALRHPINANGTGILVPGFYEDLWGFGLHKGKYEAFVQINKVRVYRDNDKDSEYDLDPATIEEGIIGANMHMAGVDSATVDNWSYACQVFKKKADFKIVLKQSKDSGFNKFNYILFNM